VATELSPALRAGAASVDITPRWGVHLAGDIARHRPAQQVWDPLHARALALELGASRACLLCLDATIITGQYTGWIREQCASRFGLEPDALMVHATQTHSAPTLGHIMLDPDFPELPPELEWVRGSEDAHSRWAASRCVEAVGQALEGLRPVSVGSISAIDGRWAHNRRAVKADGTVGMPGPTWEAPLGPTWIKYIEGPIDPEVAVLSFRDDALGFVSVVANYACHPVHVFPRPFVSADWPGALADGIESGCGPACTALVVNGACGNINPWPPFDPEYVEDHRRMGAGLAQTTRTALEHSRFEPVATLAAHVTRLPIPLRELTPKEKAHCEDVLSRHPAPQVVGDDPVSVDPKWMVAASQWSVELARARSPFLDYEIQVLRIGEDAIVGLPGEPFVELGLAIKLASPARRTLIAHCTSQYVGYIPSAEALKRGGHEASTRYWAKLVPEAFEMIRDAAIETLQAVFR
jgi:hypothetical protein